MRIAFAALTLSAFACAGAPATDARVARSQHGMVVTGSTLATDAGVGILEAGGNAVDAAVAAAFTLAVVEPSMSGLGGRTQILIRTAEGGFVGVDGTTEVPRAAPNTSGASDTVSGYATIAIPGTVAALTTALDRFGTMPLARVLAPAIRLAEDGFRLPPAEAERLARERARLERFVGSRRHFLQSNGAPLASDSTWRQPDLARVLRAIAQDGAAAFYRGWVAESIAADMGRFGGFVTLEDLAQYRARDAVVVRGSYRGYDLVGTYLPASGATTIEALHVLEQFDVATDAGSARWLAIAAEALLISFVDRDHDLATPGDQSSSYLTKAWAADRAAGLRTAPSGPRTERPEPEHTTHLSVADHRGTMVALTQSVGPLMGSRVTTAGLGFVYAATLGYLGELRPGDRPYSSQSPLIVLNDGRPFLVLGGAGARRIISAIVAVTSRVIDEELSLADAMAAPRFHPTSERIYLEVRPAATWEAAVIAALEREGFEVRPRADASYFARIHAIAYDGRTGEYLGVADPRGDGTARGVTGPNESR